VVNDSDMRTSHLLVLSRPSLTGTWALGAQPTTWNVPYGGPIAPRDVDGDGNPDLVLVSPADGALVIWGQGNGTLDPDQSTTIATSDLAKACAGDGGAAPANPERLTGATALRTAAATSREILFMGQNNLYLATLDPTAPRTFTYACATLGDLTSVSSGTKVASGDVDGDGIDDVVVGAPGQVTLYRGMPVHQ
jgi:hypothetical protein